MGLHQIKNLLHKEASNYQNQDRTTEWEKMFASQSVDKGSISRKQEFQKLNIKRRNNPTDK
jgi:hypothetical protein